MFKLFKIMLLFVTLFGAFGETEIYSSDLKSKEADYSLSLSQFASLLNEVLTKHTNELNKEFTSDKVKFSFRGDLNELLANVKSLQENNEKLTDSDIEVNKKQLIDIYDGILNILSGNTSNIVMSAMARKKEAAKNTGKTFVAYSYKPITTSERLSLVGPLALLKDSIDKLTESSKDFLKDLFITRRFIPLLKDGKKQYDSISDDMLGDWKLDSNSDLVVKYQKALQDLAGKFKQINDENYSQTDESAKRAILIKIEGLNKMVKFMTPNKKMTPNDKNALNSEGLDFIKKYN